MPFVRVPLDQLRVYAPYQILLADHPSSNIFPSRHSEVELTKKKKHRKRTRGQEDTTMTHSRLDRHPLLPLPLRLLFLQLIIGNSVQIWIDVAK